MDPRIENYMRAISYKDLEDREYEASLSQGNYIFDEDTDSIIYRDFDEVLTTFYIVDEHSNFNEAFIQKPTMERLMRSVCVVFPTKMTFRSIFNVFREAGLQVKSCEITEKKYGEQSSADFEFSTCISVAVAVALTFSSRDLLPACNVVPKLGFIYVDSNPVESSNGFYNVDSNYASPNAFKRRICVEFSHSHD